MVHKEEKRSPGTAILFTIRKILGYATLALIVVLFAPKLFVYFDHPRDFAFSSTLIDARNRIITETGPWLRRAIPTNIAGGDRTDWILALIAILVTSLFGSLAERAQTASNRRRLQKSADAYRRSQQVQPGSRLDTELKNQLAAAQTSKSVNRHELLAIFAETKKKLDKFGREVAFLAVDVVGSTQMKIGEDPSSIQYDFLEYRKMVEHVFGDCGVMKSAWTPDGVMACFAHVDDAVQAGAKIIRNLKNFNASVKLSRADFAVRCGVNAGLVYFDDAAPLESISDRVIDVAGHMQKYAEANTVAIPRKIIEPLRNRAEFTDSDLVVDGYQVSSWRAKE